MLLGVAEVAVEAAAKMLGVLPAAMAAAGDAPEVPAVFTERVPGGGFFTGTTTLLPKTENGIISVAHGLLWGVHSSHTPPDF